MLQYVGACAVQSALTSTTRGSCKRTFEIPLTIITIITTVMTVIIVITTVLIIFTIIIFIVIMIIS